jgi:hypothetical protein
VGEKMDDFEKELRAQLQARSAPGGFTDRVMARVPMRQAPRGTFLGFGLPVWRWAVAAMLVAVMVLGGLERDHQRRVAGERAREQVLLALRITGSALRDVQQKVSARDEQQRFSQKGTVRDKDDQ